MPSSPLRVAAADQDDSPQTRRITLPRLATIVASAAILYVGQEVFLPLAIAMLLTFVLSPLVSRARRAGLGPTLSVLTVAFLAFSAIGVFSLVVAGQMSSLARNLPAFQSNIITKLETLQEQGGDSGIVSRLTRMVTAINDEISGALPSEEATATPGERPMKVEVVEPQSPVQMLQDLVLPLVSPIATTGLVIVVVIFMLLEREELRDRFIRLIGANDLHRTTQMLEEAGSRVANYLLIQLLVNVIYALPIGIGLWLIGVPNAPLWGLLTLVLRFVPYIGSALSAAFPLFLAFAVSPDWTPLLWTAALFVVVELLTSNVVEPWLYGSRTGVSPLAIIVSAIFWTWIWGPLGLVLSTPLTVCLVVLGRHVPQFELFDILFGDEPVLSPHARLYQRWLAGDTLETTFRAEEALEDAFLSDYYRDTALPALMLAQADWSRGVLTTAQETQVAEVAMTMVQDLHAVVEDELESARSDTPDADAPLEPLIGEGRRILCIGGRSALDDASAAILAQSLAAEGAEASFARHTDLTPARVARLDLAQRDTVVLSFLDPSPSRASLLHLRRLKRDYPHLRVGVAIWQMPDTLARRAPRTARFWKPFRPPSWPRPRRSAPTLSLQRWNRSCLAPFPLHHRARCRMRAPARPAPNRAAAPRRRPDPKGADHGPSCRPSRPQDQGRRRRRRRRAGRIRGRASAQPDRRPAGRCLAPAAQPGRDGQGPRRRHGRGAVRRRPRGSRNPGRRQGCRRRPGRGAVARSAHLRSGQPAEILGLRGAGRADPRPAGRAALMLPLLRLAAGLASRQAGARAGDAARRIVLGLAAGCLALVGAGFLTAAAWVALAGALGAIGASLILGGLFLLLALILGLAAGPAAGHRWRPRWPR